MKNFTGDQEFRRSGGNFASSINPISSWAPGLLISCKVFFQLLALAPIVLMPAHVAAQERDVRSASGTGTITGTVVSDDADARPVRKARVSCSGPDAPGSTTLTDEAGRF